MFKLVTLNFNNNFDVDRGIQFGFNMVIIKYTVYLKLACCGSIVFLLELPFMYPVTAIVVVLLLP